jgi:NADPH-dependent 2,4-dienoyl-CoA reductase/sulfur reductase-like enzyme/rhodanese-related sulfurtransferase
MSKITVIVGGVAGGASCAARLRRQDEWATIIMIEKGPFVSFANCGLPYYIGNIIKKESDLLVADTRLFKERFRVDARVEEEVIGIDPAAKTVSVKKLGSGEIYQQAYDDLVLSPGAQPIVPNLPGVTLPGIFSLRNVPDSNRIKHWIQQNNTARAVVVGAGFIGLEMAENLTHLGIKVVLIDLAEQIMPVLDAEMTQPLVEEMEKQGISIALKDSVEKFERTAQGLKVITTAGRNLYTDMVILAIGVRPDTQLAQQAGIETTGRGHIVVNSELQTSVEHIYAAGDAIQVTNVINGQPCVLPLAGPANRQGRIIADNICGKTRRFRGVQGSSVCGLFDTTIAATGLTEKMLAGSGIDYSAIYAHPNHHVGYYPGATAISMKLLFDKKDGRVLGAQAVGKSGVERRIDVIAMAIQNGASVFDLEEAELCYAPQFGAAKDPVNIVGMIAANVMRGDLKITPWDEIGQNDAVVLDVRSYGEVSEAVLRNTSAINIPIDELRDRLDELPKNTPIHVSCAVGARANNAVRLLNHHGFDASLLPGGLITQDCLVACRDDQCRTTVMIQKDMDPLMELHAAESPLSSMPLWLLRDLKSQSILREFRLERGESMMLKGRDEGDMVLLGRGEVDVIELEQIKAQLSSTSDKRRPVRLARDTGTTFYTRTHATLFRIDQDSIDFYSSWFAMIDNLAKEKPELSGILTKLHRPALFQNLPLPNVQHALLHMEKISVAAGQDIIRQGDQPDNFYILLDGEAEVWRQDMYDDKQVMVATLTAGMHFGEDAFLMHGTRNATVRASQDTELLTLSGENFMKYISQPLVHNIDHSAAKIQLDQGQKILLDVRYEEEWDEMRIPGAILIPLPDLRKRLKELDIKQGYIVYCHAGKRSAVAAMIMEQEGYDATWLIDGIRDWPYDIICDEDDGVLMHCLPCASSQI